MNWTKIQLRAFLCAVGVVLLLVGSAGLSYGLPITSITDLNNFRDTRSLNDVGIGQGDRIQYGAQVVPNDAAGTKMAATQNGVRVPSTGYYPCVGFTANPNMCSGSIRFDPLLAGAWDLTFSNGTDVATAQTHALTLKAAADPVPFPVSVTITGSGTEPTLSWTVPGGFIPDAIRVNVYEKDSRNSQGVSDVIYGHTFDSASATSFTVPAGYLKADTNYVLNVQLIETRDGDPSAGSPNGNISRRSSSFFDFRPLSGGEPPEILLPTVGPAPDPSSGFGATYHFSVTDIVPGGKIFIDPYLAVGYDYAIGLGDPNFASVLLPVVQTDPFLLTYLGPVGMVSVMLAADTEYFFPFGGIDKFSVRDIDLSANLDPGNVNAFITGLTFAGAGNFTGTMTPVIKFVPVQPVPEPGTMMLLGIGMAGLVGYGRRRFKK